MIEINLLPDNLRQKTKKKEAVPVQTEQFLAAVPAVLGFIVFAHVSLGFMQVNRIVHLKGLQKQLKALEPQRKKLEGFTVRYESSSQEEKAALELVSKSISWSAVLHSLSAGVPEGVWLTEISNPKNELFVTGSVISLEGNEFDLINRFISNLKSDPLFMRNFSSIELSGNISNRRIGSYQVMDFVLRAVPAAK